MAFISPIPVDSRGNPKQTGSLQTLTKNDFLQLLVAKLQNQDPMSPMEDGDFISQLAQFSSLEQMNNIAGSIAESNQLDFLQMQSLNNALASGLIGKDVMASYDTVYIDETNSPNISFTLDKFADTVTLNIMDENGTIIRTITKENLGEGKSSIVWDGRDNFGNRVNRGVYTIEMTATGASGTSFTPSLSLIGEVDSVRYRDGAAYLVVDGTEIPLGDVVSVGRHGSFDEE